MSDLPPLALYVHFPWCISKCPYCDFNSHALRGRLPEERYVAALADDLRHQVALLPVSRELVSIFMGGGTPSLFSPGSIGTMIETARGLLRFTPDIEITLEANPGTIERGRFGEYRAAGVTRVSLGAQSFDDRRLAALGRIHSAAETRRAAEELHAAGLVNFNIDLMYGLPEQDIAGALADVDAALALEPAHLSQYELTLEPGTVFGAQPPPLPDDDTVDGALRACQQRLAQAGFLQYEVSAYARTGRRCRHNLNYWQFGDYLGIGAGAHGKLSHRIVAPRASLRVTRTSQWREPRRYLAAAGRELACTPVQRADLPFEFMMNALRLLDGFSEALYESRTGVPFATSAGSTAALARERGWLERRGAQWRATEKGLRFLNELLLEFMHREGNAASNETFTELSGESTQSMPTNPLK